MPWYRLKVDWTWSTTAAATTALTAINATLAAQGRPEVATRTSATVSLVVDGLTEAAAVTLRNALVPNWSTGTRTGGKASVVRRDESSL